MARITAIQNVRIVLERQILSQGTVLLADDKIAKLGRAEDVEVPEGAEIVDGKNNYLGPGFVDIHNHCGGWRFDKSEVAQHGEYYLKHGTTSLLPTFYYQMTLQQVLDGLDAMGQLMKEESSTIRGVNFEGPYLNANYGFQGEKVWPIHREEYEKVIEKGEGIIKIWSVAPEREGIEEFVAAASAIHPVFAAAHTDATAEQLYALLPYGLKLHTHHLNATGCQGGRGKGVRNFGVDEAVQLCDEIYIELISDSMAFHVSPQYLQLAYKIKGPGKTCLITDSTEFVESDEVGPNRGDLRFGTNGDLMGSVMTMDGALRNMMAHAGVSLSEAFRMASSTPAALIGLKDRGVMAKGYVADLVFLDDDLQVAGVMLGGKKKM